MLSPGYPLDPLFLPDLVKRQHPLNQGRVVWWLAVPGLDGTQKLYDVMGHIHGTLFNGPAWSSGPNGLGGIRTTGGTTARVSGFAPSLPAGAAAPWTISFWHRTYSSGNLSLWAGFGTQEVITSDSSGQFRAVGTGGAWGANYHGWFSDIDFATGIAADLDGSLHSIAMTYDSSILRFYRDGVLRTTSGATTLFTISAGPYAWQNTKHQAGSVIDALVGGYTVYNRCLTNGQIAALHRQDILGYPDLLNRYRPVVYSVPEAAPPGGFQSAWAVGANSWIGTGAA